MAEHGGPSMVAENYLASMYRMAEEGETVTVGKLADMLRRSPPSERLGLALPSVLGMLRRLVKDGLVEISGDKSVEPTARGKQLGETVVRRHRLAERLLADVLHVELTQVHTEAHKLEHALSDEVTSNINDLLGQPRTCPFGYPIPGNGASKRHPRTLAQVAEGEQWIVDRVREEDSRLLAYLIANDVLPGAAMVVQEIAPYKGTLTLLVNERPVVIGLAVASGIRVRRD